MKTYTNYYNNEINEGLFSWLGKFFNWLFTDETSEETKNFTKGAIKTASKTFSEDEVKQMQNLLKEKDPKKFEEQLAQYRKSQFEKDETKGDEWEMILLSIKIRLANDEKDKKTVELLTKRFHELTKNNPEIGKKLAAEIKGEESSEGNDKKTDKENTAQHSEGEGNQNNDSSSEQNQTLDMDKIFGDYSELIKKLPNIVTVSKGENKIDTKFEKKINEIISLEKKLDNNFTDKVKFGIALLYSGITSFGKNDLVQSIIDKYKSTNS